MADDITQQTVECPSCGTEVPSASEGTATCPECGTDVSSRPVTRDTDAPAPG